MLVLVKIAFVSVSLWFPRISARPPLIEAVFVYSGSTCLSTALAALTLELQPTRELQWLCLQQRTPLPCLLTFSGFPFERPHMGLAAETQGSAVVSTSSSVSTARASRTYVSSISPSHTAELMPEQSQREASPRWPGLWSSTITNRVVSVEIWGLFWETLVQQTSKQLLD